MVDHSSNGENLMSYLSLNYSLALLTNTIQMSALL